MSRLFVIGGIGMVLLAGVPGYGAKIVHIDVPGVQAPHVEPACDGTLPEPKHQPAPLGSICADE
ncbi:MAG TPA: hypothetical protein VGB64_05745 [Actinomycetota bacterium]